MLKNILYYQTLALGVIFILLCQFTQTATAQTGQWYVQNTNGINPENRHENSFIEVAGKFYLMGGRGTRTIQVYDPETKTWSNTNTSTNNIHHFQPVVYESKIYIIGGFSGNFPNESPLTNVLIYDTEADNLSTGPAIPSNRLRGSSGVVSYDCKFYIVSGNRRGHRNTTANGENAHVKWFDCFDPETNTWTTLPDAPNARDHFHAVVIGKRMYVASGRRSSFGGVGTFVDTEEDVDVYDFEEGRWLSGSELPDDIPTERAGASVATYGSELVVIGGETEDNNNISLPRTEILNTFTGKWRTLADMQTGRHGTQALFYEGDVYIAAGSKIKGNSEITASEDFLEAFSFDGAPGSTPYSSWTNVENIANPRSEAQCIIYENEIYLFHGFGPQIKPEATCEKYNPYTDEWTPITPMPSLPNGQTRGITHNGIALVDDVIWIVGGRIGPALTVTDEVWLYDIKEDSWSAGPTLPFRAGGGVLGRLGRKLHYVGGFDANAACDIDVHLVYDLDNTGAGWQDITSTAALPDPRNHFGATVLDGKLYIIGGQYGHDFGCPTIPSPGANVNSVHVYDPITNTWTQLADFPHDESHIEPSTFALDGKIYVVGGQTADGDEVNVYNVQTNTWTELTQYKLPHRILAPGARIFDNTLFVMAGGVPNTFNPTDITRAISFNRTPNNELSFNPKSLQINLSGSQTATEEVILSSFNGTANYRINTSNLPAWLSISKDKGEAYQSFEEIELTIDAAQVGDNSETYTYQLIAEAPGYIDATINITFNKNGGGSNPGPELQEFVLINAGTDQAIRTLNTGSDVINLDQLPNELTIEAVALTQVGSVAFTVNGTETSVEGVAPYSLAGDAGGNFNAFAFTPGVYNIVATPYSGANKSGTPGAPLTLTLTVEEDANQPTIEITALALVDASNAQTIRNLDIASGSDVINLDQLPSGLSIEALTGPNVESVEFKVNGVARTENVPPYSLAGDQTTSFTPYPFVPGTYTIEVTPYSGNSKTGEAGNTVTLSLTVEEDGGGSNPDIAVTSLVLIDASNAQAIRTLKANTDEIILDQLPATLSIEALTTTQVGSVDFQVNSNAPRTESFAPFSLAGDQTTSFTPYPFAPGTYTINVRPFSQKFKGGTEGDTFVLTLTVSETSGGGEPTGMFFSLINAGTDQPVVSPIDNNSQIDITNLSAFNVSAENAPSGTNSVVFQVVSGPSGSSTRTENVAPYALFGDVSGNFSPVTTNAGDSYTINAKAYSQNFGGGTLLEEITVSFSFVNGAARTTNATTSTTTNQGLLSVQSVYPNMVSDAQEVHVRLSGSSQGKINYVLYDQYGKSLIREQISLDGLNDISLNIDVDQLKSGLYFLSIEGDTVESKVIRLIKE